MMLARYITSSEEISDKRVFDSSKTIASPLLAFIQGQAASVIQEPASPIRSTFNQLARVDLAPDTTLDPFQEHLRSSLAVSVFASPSIIAFYDLPSQDPRSHLYGFFKKDPLFTDVCFINAWFLRAWAALPQEDPLLFATGSLQLMELFRAKWLRQNAHRFLYTNFTLPGVTLAESERSGQNVGRWVECELFGGYLEWSGKGVDTQLKKYDSEHRILSTYALPINMIADRLHRQALFPAYDVSSLDPVSRQVIDFPTQHTTQHHVPTVTRNFSLTTDNVSATDLFSAFRTHNTAPLDLMGRAMANDVEAGELINPFRPLHLARPGT